jgi:hypothetical protein
LEYLTFGASYVLDGMFEFRESEFVWQAAHNRIGRFPIDGHLVQLAAEQVLEERSIW